MNLSWSQKLFLQINRQLGKRTWLDEVMKFFAHWLIYFYFFAVLLWGVSALEAGPFKLFVKLLLTTSFTGMAASWILALIIPHPRPIEQLPGVKEILIPFQTFKSFPSDHAMGSFILFFTAILSGAGTVYGTLFFVCAVLVSAARVYVGVHYPRDIIGGIVFAWFFSWLSPWFLANVFEPLYINLLNTL